jgi:two-component system sensor histidine kinase KdpD
VRRLHRLVDNLLDQTRLESGALRPHLDWCDAHDLVNAALAGIRDSLDGHPLEIAVPADMPLFRADGALMEQVVANLLLNAALHTPAGTPIMLATGFEPAHRRIFIAVADRGPGLPAGLRERLFLKFQRGDAARAGGLGLGLAIVRGLVGAHGGEIVAAENPGGGAVFTVYLPHTPHGNVPTE